MKPGQKITAAQSEALLALYLTQGREAAAAMAAGLGVSKDYAGKLASRLGIRPITKPFASNRPRIPAAEALRQLTTPAQGDPHASHHRCAS